MGRAAARIGSGIRRARNGFLDSLDCLLVHLLDGRDGNASSDEDNWVVQVGLRQSTLNSIDIRRYMFTLCQSVEVCSLII